jgi:16S rRNA (guanine527-N7)-methyltransferase
MQAALTQYAQRLREWNQRINLVGPETLKHLERRHLADCLQLISYLPTEKSLKIMDLGTGAGLPGLVLAIACPQHQLTLVESDSRKCAFLHTVIQDLGLTNTTVLNQRLETLSATPTYQVITARAFAPLSKILPLSRGFLAPEGHWLLLKGVAVDEELRGCETLFPMTTTRWQSKVADDGGTHGWVLKITPGAAA